MQFCVHGPDLTMTTKFFQKFHELLIYSFVIKIRIQIYYIYSILSVFVNPKVFFWPSDHAWMAGILVTRVNSDESAQPVLRTACSTCGHYVIWLRRTGWGRAYKKTFTVVGPFHHDVLFVTCQRMIPPVSTAIYHGVAIWCDNRPFTGNKAMVESQFYALENHDRALRGVPLYARIQSTPT